MIPIKNKEYFISYKGTYDYDSYSGIGKCLEDKPNKEGWYEFKILGQICTCCFAKEDIICLREHYKV